MSGEPDLGPDLLSLDDLLIDANHDGYPDDIRGRILLDTTPDPSIWVAILNLAARLGLETSGFTPPLMPSDPGPDMLPVVITNDGGTEPTLRVIERDGRPAIIASGASAVKRLTRHGLRSSANDREPANKPAFLDLKNLFEPGGLLTDTGDGLADGTRLCVIIPSDLPVAVGRALVDFVARVGVETGGITLPVATSGNVPDWAIPLNIHIAPDDGAELRVVPGPALNLTGSEARVTELIGTLARNWPRLPGLPEVHEIVDWLRRSLSGWTAEGRAALVSSDLSHRQPGAGAVRLLVTEPDERASLEQLVTRIAGPTCKSSGPEAQLPSWTKNGQPIGRSSGH